MRLETKGEYPPTWPETARSVKDAADWKCIRCGHAHEPTTGYSLTVHHLDGDKANSQWWNLLPLCQRCHLTIQGRVIPERPWLFEHTAWMRSYVAGFYAWFYGGVAITREEAESHIDRYLALGQPWLYEATR